MNWANIRAGLALLCGAAVLGLMGLALKPDHKPGLGESYTRQDISDAFNGIAVLLLVAGLIVLMIGLLKAPRQAQVPDPDQDRPQS